MPRDFTALPLLLHLFPGPIFDGSTWKGKCRRLLVDVKSPRVEGHPVCQHLREERLRSRNPNLLEEPKEPEALDQNPRTPPPNFRSER
jgi:hypothetical protein